MVDLSAWIDRLVSVGLTCVLAVGGFWSGTFLLTVRIDAALWVLTIVVMRAAMTSLSFAAFVAISGLLFGIAWVRSIRPDSGRTSAPSDRTAVPDELTAIVPVYHDADVLDWSVGSLLAADAPVSVVIVTEPGDTRTIERARALADRDHVSCLVNTGSPGTKAGAINYAVSVTDPDVIGVFDADESVHPAFPGAALDRLSSCDVVQGRTVPRPNGPIEELAYYESVLLSYVSRRLLYLLTNYRLAASRAVVMRRSAFEAAGGYDPDMLTEDFAFSYACYRTGLDVDELLAYPSTIAAAHSLADWWGQRKRWMTGYVQVLDRIVRSLRPVPSVRQVLALGICASTLLSGLLMISLLANVALLFLLQARTYVLMPMVAVWAVTLGVRTLDVLRGPLDRIGWTWVLVPLLFPIYGVTTCKGLVEYLTTWDGGWYAVAKSPSDA